MSLTEDKIESIGEIGGHQATKNTGNYQKFPSFDGFVEQLNDTQKRGLSQIYQNDYIAFTGIYSNPLFIVNSS